MTLTQTTLFEQINDYKNRANPYPLYAEMLKTPVTREPDGSYVIANYRLIAELLHDPRLSSDDRKREQLTARAIAAQQSEMPIPFLRLDPPEHDMLRRQVTRQFGPPHTPDMVDSMQGEMGEIVNALLDRLQGKSRIDVVDDYAYPFPVTVICQLLGVPKEDEARFHVWADQLVVSLDPPAEGSDPEEQAKKVQQVRRELGLFMAGLILQRRQQPGNDMISRLVTDEGPDGTLSTGELITTSILLLIAGHETTVNLITNGTLTLLRHPEVLARLKREPELAMPLVEELLRYEPPVQFSSRIATADITIEGVTIPKGSGVFLMLAAADRDPQRFRDPNRFIPDRRDNQHLGFGSGIHYCFGAPLARLEVQIALNTLVSRVQNPRLVVDPPPYRQGAVLRGPRHLLVDIDGITARA